MDSLRVKGSLMFARLLIYAGLLTLPCFGLVGCGDEDPVSVSEDAVIREVAKLVKTIPASGEYAADHLPVVLHFDKEPLAVTVDGTAARVRGNKASWCFPNPNRDLGTQLFHIKWTNPDGSLNIGAFITLTVSTVDFSLPSIAVGSVMDGDADVDPDPLNRDGIWFEYDEPIIGLKSKLLTEDGEDLGWEAVWDNLTVTFRLGANGKLLENGKSYIVRMVVAEPWIYDEFACDCIDCSYLENFENIDRTIRFRTADE